jgi:hypothetical protein
MIPDIPRRGTARIEQPSVVIIINSSLTDLLQRFAPWHRFFGIVNGGLDPAAEPVCNQERYRTA